MDGDSLFYTCCPIETQRIAQHETIPDYASDHCKQAGKLCGQSEHHAGSASVDTCAALPDVAMNAVYVLEGNPPEI